MNKKLHLFVDEFGDPGNSLKSSPTFTYTGLLIAEEDTQILRETAQELRIKLMNGEGTLHWREQARTWDRRQYIAKQIATLPVELIYVVAVKRDLRAPRSILAHDHGTIFWTLQLLLERAVLAAKDWPGGKRDLVVYLSAIKGIPEKLIVAKVEQIRTMQGWIPWHLLNSKVHILQNSERDGLQIADQFAGIFGAAIHPHKLSGEVDSTHLNLIYPLIRKNYLGTTLNFGIKETSPYVQFLPWWNALHNN